MNFKKLQLPYFTMTSWFVYMNKNKSNLSKIVFLCPILFYALMYN